MSLFASLPFPCHGHLYINMPCTTRTRPRDGRAEDGREASALEAKEQAEKNGASQRKTAARDMMATCAHSLNKLQRFHGPVCHRGASGFELVNPAGRWASVSSSRVRPSQRENSVICHADSVTSPLLERYATVTRGARVLTCMERVTVTR